MACSHPIAAPAYTAPPNPFTPPPLRAVPVPPEVDAALQRAADRDWLAAVTGEAPRLSPVQRRMEQAARQESARCR